MCRLVVSHTGLTLHTKQDDRAYWAGGEYPTRITEETTFTRLKHIDRPMNGIILFRTLTNPPYDFVAPQGTTAHPLDARPHLLEFIESRFALAPSVKWNTDYLEELALRTVTEDNEAVVYALLNLADAIRASS